MHDNEFSTPGFAWQEKGGAAVYRAHAKTPLAGAVSILLAATIGLIGMAQPAYSLSDELDARLRTEKELWVATQRKTGEWSSAVPVWFSYEAGIVYFTTAPDSYKARRIKRGSPVRLWVGDKTGPSLTGTAETITDPAVIERMGAAYKRKYWIAWLGLFRPRVDRVEAGKTVAIKVTPLPEQTTAD